MSDGRSGDSDRSNDDRPAPGQVRRRKALGTTVLYRVVAENDRGIEVEVVDAPGLEPGSRFTFSRKDVLAMDRLDSLWDDLSSD